jgi:N-acetylneuraminic acid mutarotase
MNRLARIPALLSVLTLAACGGGGGYDSGPSAPPPPPLVTYSASGGVAQKGPLIKGSSVTVQELSAALGPTGKQYTFQLSSDLGTFNPNSAFTSQYLGVNVTGYYFDEVLNAVSAGPVTLNAYADLTANQALGVNLLTTLSYQRIQKLMTNSQMTFANARAQAEREVLAAFNIPSGQYGTFTALDLSGSDDGDRILAAISALFVYGNTSGALNEQIAAVQSDIGEHGQLTSPTIKATLAAAAAALDPALVAANLTQRYSSVGATFAAADIAAWIDQDGDGLVSKREFEVRDASTASLFTVPANLVSTLAGTAVSVSAGELSINATPVNGSASVAAGDALVVAPGPGTFPLGVRSVYLRSNGAAVARISFIASLLSLEVTPPSASLPKGLSQQFAAQGLFTDGSTGDMTSRVEWRSSAAAIASVNAMTGLTLAADVGTSEITAASGAISGSAMLTVTPAVVQAITITPDPVFAGVGIDVQLAAVGEYSDGTTANVTTSANWQSETPAVAAVVPTTGKLRGVSLGSTTISAMLDSVTQTVSAQVTADRWYPAGSLHGSYCKHTATRLPNGKVLIAGGLCTFGNASNTAELYDADSNTWSQAAPLLGMRLWHTATSLQDGRVLVVGGSDGMWAPAQNLASAEIFDPAINNWSPAASMAAKRTRHTATLLPNGKVLVAGGESTAGFTATAELYDPVANTWSPAGSLSAPRHRHVATLLPNGKVLIAGGELASGITASAEIYDPASNTWSPAAPMLTTRSAHTLTTLANGRVLAVAGLSNGAAQYPVTAETYDAVADQWSAAASPSIGRAAHTATLLNDGTVLIAGGSNSSPALPTIAERYDPVSNTWIGAGNLAIGRAEHTATLLTSGAVVVAGGGSAAQASSELF